MCMLLLQAGARWDRPQPKEAQEEKDDNDVWTEYPPVQGRVL